MELSDQTVGVLRNYASINPNIVVESGNKLKTISVARNVLSSVSYTHLTLPTTPYV